MITGFNTDIRHEGVTYHVQTEDKGLDSPLILSLVYVGGAIIASKRTHYDDLIQTGFDEKVLTERLQRQHKLICAAIRAGRIEELKRMGERDAPAQGDVGENNARAPSEARKASGTKRKKAAQHAQRDEAGQEQRDEVRHTPPDEADYVQRDEADQAPQVEAREETSVEQADVELSRTPAGIEIITSLIDEISALSEDSPPRANEVRSLPRVAPPVHEELPVVNAAAADTEATVAASSPFTEPPLQVEPTLAPHTDADELYLNLLEDEGDFRAGQLATIKIHVGRGTYGRRPVFRATVTVKVLGTTFRPIIFTAGTNERGIAVVRTMLPRFTSGRAAIIIRAVDADDAAEIRRIIHQA